MFLRNMLDHDVVEIIRGHSRDITVEKLQK